MTEQDFVTYQKFNSKPELNELAELLTSHEIEFELEDNTMNVDGSFTNNEVNADLRLKLRKDDFERVDEIRNSLSAELLDNVDPDYYLFQFTDEELHEVIVKSDEWSHFDVVLALKILTERNTLLTKEEITRLKTERIAELAKPAGSQSGWVAAGYVMAFLGGLFGIFIGWHLSSHKKTLPNGEQVYGYEEATRKHGSRILIIAIVMTLVSVAVRIFADFE